MATKNHYLVQWVADLQNDLVCLPVELQERWPKYQKILAIDPFQVFGWPSHNLIGKLKGCRAIEIDWDNISYRLVYQIYDKSKPKRVLILSFAEHDPAYKKAKQRK